MVAHAAESDAMIRAENLSARSYSAPLDHANSHALSWSGIIAGAFVIASLGMILLLLGFGLGLSSISPWAPRGITTSALADGAIAWLVLSQVIAGGMGGYLSGRLRHRWLRVHADEVHFRDSAQGFLAWAVALIVAAGFLSSASSGFVGAGPYSMGFRAPLEHSQFIGQLPLAGTTHAVAALGSATDEEVKLEIDADRKAAAYTALWLFVALLGGAFSAALFAIVGGRHRDHLYAIPS